jgi:hypothetical protein
VNERPDERGAASTVMMMQKETETGVGSAATAATNSTHPGNTAATVGTRVQSGSTLSHTDTGKQSALVTVETLQAALEVARAETESLAARLDASVQSEMAARLACDEQQRLVRRQASYIRGVRKGIRMGCMKTCRIWEK